MGNKFTKEEPADKEPKKSPFQRLLARFQMCPNKADKLSSKKLTTDTKALPPPPKPPLRTHSDRMQSNKQGTDDELKKSKWTDVPLQVPESPPKNIKEYEIRTTPIPPPRKHKLRIQEILEIPKKTKNVQAEVMASRAPVEEPIIVPKKVVEHVCDGTHHHVRNVIDGKVVDQIVTHTEKDLKHSKPSILNTSSLSLPSHEDLKKKDEKRARSPSKSSKKKSSASSLPTDKKQKSVHSAAEKLESYMIRCKSIGSIIPHQKTDKPKSTEHDSDNESVDSFDGLDDWDLGIIEHDVSVDVPNIPLQKVNKKLNDASYKNPDNGTINKFATKEIDRLMSSIDDESVIQRKLEYPTNPEQHKSTGNPEDTLPIRHGSYPFKKIPGASAFEDDAFFTTEFLKNESRLNNIGEFYKPSQVKLAPLAVFDSDKESEKDSYTDVHERRPEIKKTVEFTLNDNNRTQKVIETTSAKKHEANVSIDTDRDGPCAIPRRKSNTGHSNLLKFISNTIEPNSAKESQKLTTSHNNYDNLVKDVRFEKADEVQEPEIVPELRNLDQSWKRLIKSDEVNNAPLLDQESMISDLIETSSDDTRSTTIETVQK